MSSICTWFIFSIFVKFPLAFTVYKATTTKFIGSGVYDFTGLTAACASLGVDFVPAIVENAEQNSDAWVACQAAGTSICWFGIVRDSTTSFNWYYLSDGAYDIQNPIIYFNWADAQPGNSEACVAFFSGAQWHDVGCNHGPHNVLCLGPSPTSEPTKKPTQKPTLNPTKKPTPKPTLNPTKKPTPKPTLNPTKNPTKSPTSAPTSTPTQQPTDAPTEIPTAAPTSPPTKAPSAPPTNAPTFAPNRAPSNAPTQPPTKAPSFSPTDITQSPTNAPTLSPSTAPTNAPTITWSLCQPEQECAYILQVIFTVDWNAVDGFGSYLADTIWIQMKVEELVRMQLETYVDLENTLTVVSMGSYIVADVMIGSDDKEAIDTLLNNAQGADEMRMNIGILLTDETQQKFNNSAFNVRDIIVESKQIKPDATDDSTSHDSNESNRGNKQANVILIVSICGAILLLICISAILFVIRVYCKDRKASSSHAPRNDDVWKPGATVFTGAINTNMATNTNMIATENTVSQNVVGENESDKEKEGRHVVPVAPPPNPFEIKQRNHHQDIDI